MPVIPPIAATPYDTITTVLNAARTRLNDTLVTLGPVGGKLLGNNQVFTLQVVNNAWRRFQEYTANIGVTRLKQEQIIYALPPVASLDPSAQVRIDWFNYFDGANLYQAPVLPPDLMFPLKVFERQNGTASAFAPMEVMLDGLPDRNKQARSGLWEWRADGLYMPGALMTTDLKLRYAKYLPDFADVGGVQWFQQVVPMMRASDPFSLYICAEVRDGLEAETWRAKAESAANLWANRDVSMKQRANVRRQSRSGRLEGCGNYF